MPAAVPIITQAVAASIVAATGAGAIGTALIYGGAALVGGLLARELMGSELQAEDAISIRANITATNRTLPLIYGTRMVGSNDVFMEMGTEGDLTPDKEGYLWIVSVLGEGETEGIATDEHGEDLVYVDDKRVQDYSSGVIDYWFYNGTSTQTANFNIYIGTRSEEGDKYTDPLRNTSYIIYRIQYDRENFVGIPRRELVLKGLKVEDIRGGSRSAYSNPALILFDYMTNKRYGLGWSESLMDLSSWREAATYCDTIKGWEINLVINSQTKSQVIIDTILGHFRGYLIWYDGKLYLRYMDLLHGEAIVFDLKDEHIARDSDGKALVSITHPSTFSMPDGMSVSYIDEKNNWAIDNFIIGEEDGQIRQINFVGYTDRALANEMGIYSLERQRLNRVLSFVLRSDAIALDPNDLIYVQSSELGLSQTLARVKSASVRADGLVSISAVLDSEDLYNQEYEPDTSKVYTTNLPATTDPPPSVTLSKAPEEEVYDYRERSYVRLNVFFDPPALYPWFSHVDVYVGFPENKEQPSAPPPEDYVYRFSASNDFQLDPVEEGQTYYFKLVSVSDFSVKESFGDALGFSHKVKGVIGVLPACPLYLDSTVNMSSVELYSAKIDSPDISGYEFRVGPLGASWMDSIFLTKQSNPSISFSGVTPGEYTFWINTQHYNGYYCPSPVFTDVSIPDPPPNSRLFFNLAIDFRDGVHDNTEPLNLGTELKRIGGESREGSFTTDEIDTRNINPEERALIYIKGNYTVAAGGDTWNDLAGPNTTWFDMAYLPLEGRWLTWNEMIPTGVLHDPEKLKITVFFSKTPGGPYKESHNFELLTGIVCGRYIKIRFDIIDATLASFITLDSYSLNAAYLIESLLISA